MTKRELLTNLILKKSKLQDEITTAKLKMINGLAQSDYSVLERLPEITKANLFQLAEVSEEIANIRSQLDAEVVQEY